MKHMRRPPMYLDFPFSALPSFRVREKSKHLIGKGQDEEVAQGFKWVAEKYKMKFDPRTDAGFRGGQFGERSEVGEME